jgi:isoleucyl-tRNA synthetase
MPDRSLREFYGSLHAARADPFFYRRRGVAGAKGERQESGSIFTDRWRWDDETLTRWRDAALEDRWARLLEIREEVLKALETKRTGGGIGSPLEAKVILYSKHEEYARFLKENESELPALFITSQVECTTTADPDMKQCEKIPLSIRIEKASGTKCQRCWNYRTTVGTDDTYNDICSRCVEVVRKLNKEG